MQPVIGVWGPGDGTYLRVSYGPVAGIAYARDSLLLGITNDITASVSIRNDKNDALQVAFTQDIGATRMDEKGVVRILCAE